MRPTFRCVVHGSLRKHLKEMGHAVEVFKAAGIEVLAPDISSIVKEEDGFLFFKGEERSDPRLIELLYLQNLRRLGKHGFSYFVNPGGYVGKSVSYELGIAHASNVPCYFERPLADHPAYVGTNSIWTPELLVEYIMKHRELPNLRASSHTPLHKLWRQLVMPSSVVSTGAIIEYNGSRGNEPEVLMVKTHKWRNLFSVVGGKVRRNERLDDTLRRVVKTETGLDGVVDQHLCTFDEIENSGYYATSALRLFVDNVIRVDRKRVVLNEDAQEYVWLPARQALKELPIEPNARHTLELYARTATLPTRW